MGCSSSSSTKVLKNDSSAFGQEVAGAAREARGSVPPYCSYGCDDDDNASVRSVMSVRTGSSVPSALGSHSKYQVISRRISDDLQSDIPTIAESIADMQDLECLTPARTLSKGPLSMGHLSPSLSSEHSGRWPSLLKGSEEDSWLSLASTATTTIDNRPHPLAPSGLGLYEQVSAAPTPVYLSDLGAISDVPSCNDDSSEDPLSEDIEGDICVTFPEPPCNAAAASAGGGVSSTPSERTSRSNGVAEGGERSRSGSSMAGIRRPVAPWSAAR